MYLSGYRGLWITVGFFLLVYFLIQRRIWLLLGGVVASLPVLPAVFYARLTSVVDFNHLDSSELDRIARAEYAYNLLQQSPWIGWGWASAGYVHSDWLQLATNLGLPAAAALMLWLLNTMRSIYRILHASSWAAPYAAAILATLAGLVLTLGGEGLIVWPQLMLPIWFFIGLSDKLVELAQLEARRESAPQALPGKL